AIGSAGIGTLQTTALSQTLDNIGSTAQTVTYNITPWTGTATNSLLCSGTPISVVVTVEPTPVISSPNKKICDNTSTALAISTSTTTSNPTYYTWTVSSVGANITGASGSGGIGTLQTTALSQTLDNIGSTSQTVTYNITPWTGTAPGSLLCSGTPISVVVTVDPTPVISSPNKSICKSTSTAIIVSTSTATSNTTYYTWTVSNIGANITGATSGPTDGTPLSTSIDQTLNNSGSTPQSVTYNITPWTGTATNALLCAGSTIAVVITVTPQPAIIPMAATVCSATGFTVTPVNITQGIVPAGTTYSWSAPSVTGGITGGAANSGSQPNLNGNLTNPTNIAQTATYSVTPSSGGCAGLPFTVLVTVNPKPAITDINITICSGAGFTSIPQNITNGIVPAGTLYNWLTPSGSGFTGGTASLGSLNTISGTLINTTTSIQTATYIVTPRYLNCQGAAFRVIVTINPAPATTSITGDPVICESATNKVYQVGGHPGSTYVWTVPPSLHITSPTGLYFIIVDAVAGAASSGDKITVVETITSTGCVGSAKDFPIIVTPIIPGVGINGPEDVCLGAEGIIYSVPDHVGFFYSWILPVGAVITSDPNLHEITVTYKSFAVSGQITVLETAGPVCTIVYDPKPVSIHPCPSISGSAAACENSTGNVYVTEPGMANYTWTISSGGSISAGGGLLNNTITVTWDGPGARFVTVNYTNSSGLSASSATVFNVTVNPAPSIATNPQPTTVCEFDPATFKVTTLNGTSPTYQWSVDKNDGSGFVPVSNDGTYEGATTATLKILASLRSMNGYKYHVVVTDCEAVLTSDYAVLTVNTAAELTLLPFDVSVCFGNDATMKADAIGTDVTWQWWVNRGAGAGFVVLEDDAYFSGSTEKTLTITNAQGSFNNWIFRAIATGLCGLPAPTNFAKLMVIAAPVIALQPVNKVICEYGSATFIGNGSGYNGLQWQLSLGGGEWIDLYDDDSFFGTGSNQLTILNAPVTLNASRYRLGLIGSCTTVYTNPATFTVNPNPVVIFTDPVFACGNVPVVLAGNPTGGSAPYTHRWSGDVGPLNSFIVQSPTFNTGISDDYNLNYKVTDSKGCTANDDLAVTVDSPSADFTRDIGNGCTPLTVTFTKDMTGIAKFWWDFNDGLPIDSVTASPVHQFTNTNASSIVYYNVKLTVLSPRGCYDTFSTLITVYPEVDATFTATADTVCSGTPVIFTSLSGASEYLWDYGDGVSAQGANVSSHIYTNLTMEPVVRRVKLTAASFYNCTDVTTIDITVMPVPLPQFIAEPASQIFDVAGNTVTFTNATNPGVWSYLWKFGDGDTSSVQSPVHTYTGLGEFNVTLVVNNGSCSDSVEHNVSVLPKAPVANFDSIPQGCEPLSFAINNTSLNTEIPGTTYSWDFGDGSISTAKNPEYTYFDPGIYRIDLIVTGPGGVSIKTQIIHVYPTPQAYFEIAPAKVIINDEKVRCFNLSQGADSYLWDFGDGDTSNVKEPFHKYMESGEFDITLWAYSDNGCKDTYLLSPGIIVEPAGDIRFSTVFTPNKDGPIEVTVLPEGGIEIDQFFFPPNREKVIDYKLQIFNRLGVLIFESHDINIPWNGYYRGNLCQQGVYVWYVEGKYANGQPFKKVGDVTLLH
ncbi:MAG: PKD domain-containing protein, partial [Bacteroidota bacterium]